MDPDQLASQKPADLDQQCFQSRTYLGSAWKRQTFVLLNEYLVHIYVSFQLFKSVHLHNMLYYKQQLLIHLHLGINSLPPGNFFMFFWLLLFFHIKINLFKNSFRNTIRVSNSLDPDMVPNCLHKISADDTRR